MRKHSNTHIPTLPCPSSLIRMSQVRIEPVTYMKKKKPGLQPMHHNKSWNNKNCQHIAINMFISHLLTWLSLVGCNNVVKMANIIEVGILNCLNTFFYN